MIDPWLVVTLVGIVLAITGGVKISIRNINIGTRTKEKDDTK